MKKNNFASNYCVHSPLYCQGRRMASQCGVQQGDPCGPAALSWGIHSIVEGLDSLVEWQLWYLDDGLLVGSRDQLQKALVYVANHAREAGVELNVGKCVMWGPAVTLGKEGTRHWSRSRSGNLAWARGSQCSGFPSAYQAMTHGRYG